MKKPCHEPFDFVQSCKHLEVIWRMQLKKVWLENMLEESATKGNGVFSDIREYVQHMVTK